MKLSIPQIRLQFKRAEKLGWLPYFEEAVGAYTHGIFDAADLMAIASRETNLDPKWLKKPGDGGNGFGLMQADKRSFPEFTKGDGWKDARTGILFGAKVLMQKWEDYRANVGKQAKVKSSKTGKYSTYTGKLAMGSVVQHVVLSSYNCGRWAQYAFAKGQDIDKYSTGKDYGADVMARANEFRSLLAKETFPSTMTTISVASSTSSAAASTEVSTGTSTETAASGTILPPDADSTLSTEPPPENPEQGTFAAYVPQIDTAKRWFKSLFAGTSVGAAFSTVVGLPEWMQIVLFSLIGVVIVGTIVVFVLYYKQVFHYVTAMNTLAADPRMLSPEIQGGRR